jgi:hypothetical protein
MGIRELALPALGFVCLRGGTPLFATSRRTAVHEFSTGESFFGPTRPEPNT